MYIRVGGVRPDTPSRVVLCREKTTMSVRRVDLTGVDKAQVAPLIGSSNWSRWRKESRPAVKDRGCSKEGQSKIGLALWNLRNRFPASRRIGGTLWRCLPWPPGAWRDEDLLPVAGFLTTAHFSQPIPVTFTSLSPATPASQYFQWESYTIARPHITLFP